MKYPMNSASLTHADCIESFWAGPLAVVAVPAAAVVAAPAAAVVAEELDFELLHASSSTGAPITAAPPRAMVRRKRRRAIGRPDMKLLLSWWGTDRSGPVGGGAGPV